MKHQCDFLLKLWSVEWKVKENRCIAFTCDTSQSSVVGRSVGGKLSPDAR